MSLNRPMELRLRRRSGPLKRSIARWDGWRARLAMVRATIPALTVFAACLIVPFIILCAIVGHKWTAAEQARSTAQMATLADATADDVARFLDGHVTILRALATSPALDHNDFDRLAQQARELLEDEGIGVTLRGPSGQILLDTSGVSSAGHADVAGLPAEVAHASHVSDLVERGAGKSLIVTLDMPVVRDGARRFTLSAVLHPVAFDDLLRRGGVGGGLMGAVVDRQGRVIGHSATSDLQVGQVVTGFEQLRGNQGFWLGTNPRGLPLRVAYRRLHDTGWMVSIAMTEAAFRAPLERSLWGLGTLTLALILGAAVLTVPVIRRMHAARRKLNETSELLRLAQAAAGAGVWDWDVRGDRVRLSPLNARMHGLPVPDDAPDMRLVISVAAWEARVFPQDLPAVWEGIERARTAGGTFSAEFRTHDPEATKGYRWVQTLGSVVRDEHSGEAVRFVGLHLDVTARREVEETLRASAARLSASEERLALALDSGQGGLFDWDIAGKETWFSQRWLDGLGYNGDARLHADDYWMDTVHPEDREHVRARMRAHLKGLTPAFECEYRQRRTDGSYIWVLNRARVTARATDGWGLRLVGTMIDISQRKTAELSIEHMALHDALTGLPNRTLFRQHLDRAVRRAVFAPHRHALLALDLDRFKAVNDTYGHPKGDRMLCLVAERIRAAVREQDTVARLGGDEFAVILGDIDGAEETCRICERIIAAVDEPILLDDVAIDIGVSVGVALMPDDGATAEEIFQRADAALYEAKAAGRNTYRMFEAEAHARTATRSLLALDMKEAIRRGDFFLVYQPIIDVTNGSVVSFEALMRWRHPERGFISPGEFIPVAEETGLIVPLGTWALKEACREALNWPEPLRIGVNVSAVQFRGGLEEAVIAALASSGLPAERLKLEVTESLLVQNWEQAVAVLHRLRALGVRIALDDFGTGYSSLSYLRRFPFDKLKIDRAFIRDIADPDAAAIVRAVVGIGERLGMGIVAEGVETVEQLELVRREGCTQVQGYLFSKPLPAAEARAFAKAHREQAAA
ncbi:EAL domain-containing protein [Methylobacterium sp. E-066]|uniref:bifunctional diguanylate cyclase/phosphodiesterase n=1 Tax=Methylobacterium sp. E-066 TaxID=2836584 RepID=UPI001FB9D881|nr:EAL domain-containing protein [Methylobacterium sp. E-066]MCJ2139397.1 EAL domain-containing protein [Methylobacterium sp. E-066]